MNRAPIGPPHDPDNVLEKLAPHEADDEAQLAAAALAANLSVAEMRRAIVAINDNITNVRVLRIVWRDSIRRASGETTPTAHGATT